MSPFEQGGGLKGLQRVWATKYPKKDEQMNSADNNKGDVLIVGGGISGIQASLDLANSGFRVFLVDKSPALGGKMSQLDKTFPTLDCGA